MRIIVVGCGRFGSELTYRLFRRGHEVAVIDIKASAFNNLPLDFGGRLVEGDALNQEVLKRAGVERAEAMAVVTSSDAINIVVGHVGNAMYHISKVVARNFDPLYRSVYDTFEIQMIASSSWGAQRLEEMLYHTDVRTIFSAGNGEVEIYEITVPESWNGRTLGEITNISECVPASVTRAGRAQLPDKAFVVQTGDLIHVSATFEGMEAMRNRITTEG